MTYPTLETLARYEPRSMHDQLPVVWDHAEGFRVYDDAGRSWLDFSSGIFVANAGHGHPAVVQAIVDMARRPLLHNYYFPSEIRARLVEQLVAMTPRNLDCVMLLTTGAEATECAIKLARIHGRRTDPTKVGVVSLDLGFHGKTMGAQQAGGRPAAKAWIGTLDPNFHQIAPESFDCGMAYLAGQGVSLDTIAAFIVEPYQGWSARFLSDEFVRAMRAWATAHGALVIFDEVQSGFGRTGRLFAYESFGVEADLVCCGKGISGSLPLSAVLGPRALVDVDSTLNSTHGGNPVCCAAALANLHVLENEHLIERAARTGAAIEPSLRSLVERFPRHVSAVYGRGLIWGIHLVDPYTGALDISLADDVTERAMHKGLLLVRTGCGTIKIGPPLCIPEDVALEGVALIEESIAEAIT